MQRRNMIAALALAVASLPLVAATAGAQELWRAERQVRRELVTLPFYSVFDNMTFRVDGTKVTLMGKVTRPTLKSGAEKSIKDIEGVREIDNQIEVFPVSSNDDRIRVATFRAIYYHPMMTRYAIQAVPPIHIIVQNGDVSLEGVVGSESEKNLAGIQASGVNGSFSITNNLQVDRN
jgi:hyperosmotically inducible periplasmic protein